MGFDIGIFRSAYFKTALNTAVEGQKLSVKVEECSFNVLSAIVDSLYNRSLDESYLNWEEATSLFLLADLFSMDYLKNAAADVIKPLLNLENILETAELAVKHNCEKLKDLSCDFALSRIPPNGQYNDLSEKLLLILPMLGLKALERSYVASNVLHVNHVWPGKRRKDFSSATSYANYVRLHLKPNMLVMCNQESQWQNQLIVCVGCVGRVVSFDAMNDLLLVKWDGHRRWTTPPSLPKGELEHMDILTLPINCELLVVNDTSETVTCCSIK